MPGQQPPPLSTLAPTHVPHAPPSTDMTRAFRPMPQQPHPPPPLLAPSPFASMHAAAVAAAAAAGPPPPPPPMHFSAAAMAAAAHAVSQAAMISRHQESTTVWTLSIYSCIVFSLVSGSDQGGGHNKKAASVLGLNWYRGMSTISSQEKSNCGSLVYSTSMFQNDTCMSKPPFHRLKL